MPVGAHHSPCHRLHAVACHLSASALVEVHHSRPPSPWPAHPRQTRAPALPGKLLRTNQRCQHDHTE